jgi:hypothetical protein
MWRDDQRTSYIFPLVKRLGVGGSLGDLRGGTYGIGGGALAGVDRALIEAARRPPGFA